MNMFLVSKASMCNDGMMEWGMGDNDAIFFEWIYMTVVDFHTLPSVRL